jgi:sugar O-acyltransferase (sialic acid O-acetyltransferase NeuD family)
MAKSIPNGQDRAAWAEGRDYAAGHVDTSATQTRLLVMDNDRPLVFVAASGLARETAEAARADGRRVLGCLDDDRTTWGEDLGPAGQVLGGLEKAYDNSEAEFVLCAGSGQVRREMLSRLRGLGGEVHLGTVIHPSVEVPSSCAVGEGSILLAGTVLTASVRIGRHVVCMSQAVLTHDDVVGDFATLCASVTLGGGVTVGEAAYVGMSASIHPNRTLGVGSVLGMGSVLLHDLPDGETWAGNPARVLGVR